MQVNAHLHKKQYERFFDTVQDWMYGMYDAFPPYRRSYFENNAIRCLLYMPIIKSKDVAYSLTISVINNPTLEDLEADNYYLYDSTTGATVKITKTLNKVYPAWSWTIPIYNLPLPHKEEVTMDFPASNDHFILHKLFLITNPYPEPDPEKDIIFYDRVGGDTLYTVVNLVED